MPVQFSTFASLQQSAIGYGLTTKEARENIINTLGTRFAGFATSLEESEQLIVALLLQYSEDQSTIQVLGEQIDEAMAGYHSAVDELGHRPGVPCSEECDTCRHLGECK